MKRKPLASFSFATPLSKKMKESKSQSRLKQSTCVPRPDSSPLLFPHSLLIWGWRFHLEAQNAQTKDYFNLEQITRPSFSLTLCRVPLLSFPSRLPHLIDPSKEPRSSWCWWLWWWWLVRNCTIFLCSLDVRNDQCRGPSIKEKDHPVG